MITRTVRRLFAVVLALLSFVGISFALAAPAGAAVPLGWEQSPDVDVLHALLVLGGVPILLFAIIFALGYGPAMARGESVTPGGSNAEDQWLGGPRQAAGELQASADDDAADTAQRDAGGASGTW